MLISSYNPEALGDTLIVITAQDQADQVVKQAGDIVVITASDGTLLGVNFFNVSQWLGQLDGSGAITLSAEQVAQLNQALAAAGFTDQLESDATPKFVIGKIVAFEAHPDSDHLHVAQVDLGDHTEQIVCGAPNAALGQTVVAALPGAMMPDGKIIWPGALRGVASYGMLSAARELGIPGAPAKRGILLMPDELAAGTPFDFELATKVVAAQNQD